MRSRREPFKILGSLRSSGVIELDDRRRPVQILVIDLARTSHLAHPGSMPSRFQIGPSLRDHRQLLDHVLKGEALRRGQLLAIRPSRPLECPLGLLDQSEDVTMSRIRDAIRSG